MKNKSMCILLVLTLQIAAFSADWPQFRGFQRDSKSTETGLLKKWPQNGPELLWSYQGIGVGYSSVNVADGIVYINGVVGEDKTGTLFAFDPKGDLKWKVDYGPEWSGRHPGPHTTPIYHNRRLYHMSGQGIASCLDAKTGKIIWSVDTVKNFNAVNLKWGIAEAPLVVDDKVIITPGGSDATMVALDKNTGKTIWTTKGLSELSAYCTSQLVEVAGRKLILTMVAKSIIFVDPQNGQLVMQIPHTCKFDISAVCPIFHSNMLYITNGYGYGGIMYQISPDFGSYTKKWVDKELDCHHGGVIFLDGHIYGAGSKNWVCIELETGKIKYVEKGIGKGSVLFADGMLYCYDESKGDVALVKAESNKYDMVSSFTIEQGTGKHWAHPVISDGILYIRHGGALMAYDVKQK